MGFWDENWGLVWMIDGEGLGFNVSVLGFFMGRNLVERLGLKELQSGLWGGVWVRDRSVWCGEWVHWGAMMQRSCARLRGFGVLGAVVDNAVKGALGGGALSDARRSASTSSADAPSNEKIIAAVVVERLPAVLPDQAPPVQAFESFSFDWRQQFRRVYPQEFLDASSSSREADEGEPEFEPGPTVTEADKTNDRRSLDRALTRRLYLLIRGTPYGGAKDSPVWHFPEKEYAKEDTLRKCAEEVIKPFVNNPADVYFVGNAPCGHLHYRLSEPNYKRFFFKSQLIAGKVHVKGKKIKDYAWVSKEELPEYLDPSDLEYMKKMLID